MKARPYFTIAFEKVRQLPAFKDIVKNVILRSGNET